MLQAKELNDFLYGFSNGFLTNFRSGKGIDKNQLQYFFEILDNFRKNWRGKNLIQKDIIYELVSVVPALHQDLILYSSSDSVNDYKNILYKLDTAISMCLSPNDDDPNFDVSFDDLIDIY